MIELSPLTVIIIMLGALILVLVTGLPVVFTMGSIGVILGFLMGGEKLLTSVLITQAFGAMGFYSLTAVPLFVFMAIILQSSGIGEEMFRCLRLWVGRIPGGLAMAVVIVSVFIAALSGMSATGIIILGIVAVPVMLELGYSKEMALGPVMFGGCLASLIPPSIAFIVYGAIAKVSVGQLFIGGIIPGLILASLAIIYIGIRCYFNPSLGPPLPPEERGSWGQKFASTKGLILPILLIFSVLGSIFMGIASATEAAGVGAVGALACAAIKRNLKWQYIKQANLETIKTTSMIIWIFVGAYCFKGILVWAGGTHFITQWVAGLQVPPMALVGLMQVVFIVMGCFMMEVVIQLLTLPIFLPIIEGFGMSRLWFGVLFLTTVQTSYISPPFGFALFFMRSVVPEGITMRDIITSILAFLPIQILAIVLVMFFPQLALWLPSLMSG